MLTSPALFKPGGGRKANRIRWCGGGVVVVVWWCMGWLGSGLTNEKLATALNANVGGRPHLTASHLHQYGEGAGSTSGGVPGGRRGRGGSLTLRLSVPSTQAVACDAVSVKLKRVQFPPLNCVHRQRGGRFAQHRLPAGKLPPPSLTASLSPSHNRSLPPCLHCGVHRAHGNGLRGEGDPMDIVVELHHQTDGSRGGSKEIALICVLCGEQRQRDSVRRGEAGQAAAMTDVGERGPRCQCRGWSHRQGPCPTRS
jgi:hypothetical protein